VACLIRSTSPPSPVNSSTLWGLSEAVPSQVEGRLRCETARENEAKLAKRQPNMDRSKNPAYSGESDPPIPGKVRAEAEGTLGAYTPFPGGINRQFLEVIGTEPGDLRMVIDGAESDQVFVDWVDAHRRADVEVRVAEFRTRLPRPLPANSEWIGKLDSEKRRLVERFPGVDLTQVDNFMKLICIEEGHPIPHQSSGSR